MTSRNPSAPRRINFWAVLCVALLCATAAYIAHLLVEHPVEKRPVAQRLWNPIAVTPDGRAGSLSAATRRLEFWTPSARTKDHLTRENGAIRDRDKWETITSDEPVTQFGMLLRTNANVLGYRRAEVWGHGRTTLKPGWWWTMTVTPNYSVQTLTQTYREFWKSTNTIFLETTENPAEE